MMDDEDLQRVYQWVDDIPLSRAKKSIARDFADGVLTAEIVAHYFPKLVEVHNYPSANSFAQKMYNWNTLSEKVFKKMGFTLLQEEKEAISNCAPQAVERLLKKLQMNMAKYSARKDSARKSGGEDDYPPVTASKPYHAPPKPEAKAPTMPHGPGCLSSRAASKPSAAAAGGARSALDDPSVREVLAEKDSQLLELQETVDILEVKIQKLEQLVRLKDSKIATLQARVQQSQPS